MSTAAGICLLSLAFNTKDMINIHMAKEPFWIVDIGYRHELSLGHLHWSNIRIYHNVCENSSKGKHMYVL